MQKKGLADFELNLALLPPVLPRKPHVFHVLILHRAEGYRL